MSGKRSGFWLFALVFLRGHWMIWCERARRLKRDDNIDGIEALFSLVSIYFGQVVAWAGHHPTIMDNLIAGGVDAQFGPLPPIVLGSLIHIQLEPHQVFGAGYSLCGLLGFVGVFEWPSPNADGKMPVGIPVRVLTRLVFQRLCGSIAAVIFCTYNLCLSLPPHPHSMVGAGAVVGFVAYFVLCVRAGKRYGKDEYSLKKAAQRSHSAEKRETLPIAAL